jgi:hypothetical protein
MRAAGLVAADREPTERRDERDEAVTDQHQPPIVTGEREANARGERQRADRAERLAHIVDAHGEAALAAGEPVADHRRRADRHQRPADAEGADREQHGDVVGGNAAQDAGDRDHQRTERQAAARSDAIKQRTARDRGADID